MPKEANPNKRTSVKLIEPLVQEILLEKEKHPNMYFVLPVECRVKYKLKDEGKVKIPFDVICCSCVKTDIEFVSIK